MQLEFSQVDEADSSEKDMYSGGGDSELNAKVQCDGVNF